MLTNYALTRRGTGACSCSVLLAHALRSRSRRSVTSVSPVLPVASCHIYSCRARWRRYGRCVIASGHKQAFYSKHKTDADTFTHLVVLCVYSPSSERRLIFYSVRFNVFFLQNVHVVARSLTEQLANRAQSLASVSVSYLSQPSRREV